MKLVKFKDGTYGIRKFNFVMLSFEYFDFSCYSFWRTRKSKYFKDCKAEYSVAVQEFNNLIDKGEIVK